MMEKIFDLLQNYKSIEFARFLFRRNGMKKTYHEASPFYTHAISVTGGRTVYISGQTAYSENHEFIEQDFSSQVDHSLVNLKKVLASAHASPEDVVMIRVYVKSYHEDAHLNVLMDKFKRFFTGPKLPASTLIGVQSLAKELLLFEIEAVAVIDDLNFSSKTTTQ
jgi:2-iminobutanoate/2-iminopropanoate deaminase